MTGIRRVAKIEEKDYIESPAVRKIKEKIFFIQKKLLLEICPPDSKPTRQRTLAESVDKWVTQKLFRESELTFKSIASVNWIFEGMYVDLAKECEKLGIGTTHAQLCEGMRMLLKWYQILAIDAVLQNPLHIEIANNEKRALTKTSEILNKCNLLIKQIQQFNFKLNDLEERYSKNKTISLDFSEEDPRILFYPLLKEEKALANMQYAGMDNLIKERQVLENNVVKLHEQIEDAVADYKKNCQIQREKRCKLSDSKLNDIDAYYVNEFKENKSYRTALQNYTKKFDSQTKKQEDKILAIESLLIYLIAPFKEFSAEIDKFYRSTYIFPVGVFQHAVNGIYNVLKEEYNIYKSSSLILALDREYEDEYKYIRETLPLVKQEVAKQYTKAVNEFLRSVGSRPWRQIVAIRSEANNNFENDINEYTTKLKAKHKDFNIQPFRLPEIYKKFLNDSWIDAFDKYFNKTLVSIKAEFEQLQKDKSDHAFELIKQLHDDYTEAKTVLLQNVIREESLQQRFKLISSLLADAYRKFENDPVFAKIAKYIMHRNHEKLVELEQEKRRQFEVQKNLATQKEKERLQAITITKQNYTETLQTNPDQKGVVDTGKSQNNTIAVTKNKPRSILWKRIAFWGLLTFASMAAAFTVIGLMVGITVLTALTLVGSGLLIGGSGYTITSCCSRNFSDAHDMDVNPPSAQSFVKHTIDPSARPISDALIQPISQAPMRSSKGFFYHSPENQEEKITTRVLTPC